MLITTDSMIIETPDDSKDDSGMGGMGSMGGMGGMM
jgi:hypothetical protein